MFSYISGKLISKTPTKVVVETAGIGYEIFIPLLTYDKLPQTDDFVKLFVQLIISDTEGLRLFGFFTYDEKEVFKQLISVSKIGPKLALSILSVLSVNELANAVISKDIALIKSVPGIGKKTAERLIIELKDKIAAKAEEDFVNIKTENKRNLFIEAESALITLGYKNSEIKKVLQELAKNQSFANLEELIKSAIKLLYSKRNL